MQRKKRKGHDHPQVLRVVWAAIVGACLAIGCGQAQVVREPVASKPVDSTAGQVAVWLECAGCPIEQIGSLVKDPEAAAEALPILIEALQNGPAAEARASFETKSGERFDSLAEYAKKHPRAQPASTRDEWVKRNTNSYRIRYRIAAAQALGAIGGNEALAELKKAQELTTAPDMVMLQSAIQAAINQIVKRPESSPTRSRGAALGR
jgi:hypothetical protein